MVEVRIRELHISHCDNCILVDGADQCDEYSDGDEGEDSGHLEEDENGGKW